MGGTGSRQLEPDGANIARIYDYLLGGSHNSPADQTAAPFRPRSYPDVLRFFGGYNLVEPGLVHVSRWQPDTPEEAAQADQVAAYGGVGRKQ